jgi:tetratricopeptide (TPR) repeat protein
LANRFGSSLNCLEVDIRLEAIRQPLCGCIQEIQSTNPKQELGFEMKDFEDGLNFFDSSSSLKNEVFAPSSTATSSPCFSSVAHDLTSTPSDMFGVENSISKDAWQRVDNTLKQDWHQLSARTTEIAQLLSLFAPTAIPWQLVDYIAHRLHWVEQEVDDARFALYDRQLLSLTDEGLYLLDPLTHQFLKTKFVELERAEELKQTFANALITYVKQLPAQTSVGQYQVPTEMIPHVAEVANRLNQYLKHDDLHFAFTALGQFYTDRSEYSSAEKWYRQCVELLITRCGEQHPTTAISLNNLASLYQLQGNYAEAEPLFSRALAVHRQSSNTLNFATGLNNLAGLYKLQGNYEQAEAMYLEALRLKKEVLGEVHPSVATSLNNLASTYYAQGRYSEAEAIYKRVFQLKRCLLGKKHASLIPSLNNLASVYHAQNRYRDAVSLYVRAMQLSTEIWGETHPNTVSVQQNLRISQTACGMSPISTTDSFWQHFTQRLSIGARNLINLNA